MANFNEEESSVEETLTTCEDNIQEKDLNDKVKLKKKSPTHRRFMKGKSVENFAQEINTQTNFVDQRVEGGGRVTGCGTKKKLRVWERQPTPKVQVKQIDKRTMKIGKPINGTTRRSYVIKTFCVDYKPKYCDSRSNHRMRKSQDGYKANRHTLYCPNITAKCSRLSNCSYHNNFYPWTRVSENYKRQKNCHCHIEPTRSQLFRTDIDNIYLFKAMLDFQAKRKRENGTEIDENEPDFEEDDYREMLQRLIEEFQRNGIITDANRHNLNRLTYDLLNRLTADCAGSEQKLCNQEILKALCDFVKKPHLLTAKYVAKVLKNIDKVCAGITKPKYTWYSVCTPASFSLRNCESDGTDCTTTTTTTTTTVTTTSDDECEEWQKESKIYLDRPRCCPPIPIESCHDEAYPKPPHKRLNKKKKRKESKSKRKSKNKSKNKTKMPEKENLSPSDPPPMPDDTDTELKEPEEVKKIDEVAEEQPKISFVKVVEAPQTVARAVGSFTVLEPEPKPIEKIPLHDQAVQTDAVVEKIDEILPPPPPPPPPPTLTPPPPVIETKTQIVQTDITLSDTLIDNSPPIIPPSIIPAPIIPPPPKIENKSSQTDPIEEIPIKVSENTTNIKIDVPVPAQPILRPKEPPPPPPPTTPSLPSLQSPPSLSCTCGQTSRRRCCCSVPLVRYPTGYCRFEKRPSCCFARIPIRRKCPLCEDESESSSKSDRVHFYLQSSCNSTCKRRTLDKLVSLRDVCELKEQIAQQICVPNECSERAKVYMGNQTQPQPQLQSQLQPQPQLHAYYHNNGSMCKSVHSSCTRCHGRQLPIGSQNHNTSTLSIPDRYTRFKKIRQLYEQYMESNHLPIGSFVCPRYCMTPTGSTDSCKSNWCTNSCSE